MKNFILTTICSTIHFIGFGTQANNLSNTSTKHLEQSHQNNSEIALDIDYAFNFGPSNSPNLEGFIQDYGLAFGQQDELLNYGWIIPSGNAEISNFTTLRTSFTEVDLLRPSFITINSAPENQNATWELAVPNGSYRIIVQAGDIEIETVEFTRHQIDIEGESVLDFESFGSSGVETGVIEVEITDGRVTLDSPEGLNTKINSIVIQSIDVLQTPTVIGSIPKDGSVDIDVNSSISANFLSLPNINSVGLSSIDNTSIDNSSVKLFKIENNQLTEVSITVNGTGGGDAINISTSGALEAETQYLYAINGVKDVAGATLLPHTATFTTGEASEEVSLDNISFENKGKVAGGAFTSLTMGPDGKLYALLLNGEIKRWDIAIDGTLENEQTLFGLTQAYGGSRLAIGLAFSPLSTADHLEAYVTHSSFVFNDGPAYDGSLSKLSGPNLETEQEILTHLPRSVRDHLSNSLIFDPNNPNVILFNQGSNSAGGDADAAWGGRPERLLTAATLKLDLSLLPDILPLDVQTSEDLTVINNAPNNSLTMSDGFYNPYAENAPLTIFASGIRNAYDLVWHSNGLIYVPTNGTAGGSNSPASVMGTRRPDGTFYNGPEIPAVIGNNVQKDFLFKIDPSEPIGYYGHPNPLRGEYVLNDGFESTSTYPSDVVADENYLGFAYDFDFNKSPNGVIEYQTEGPLKGALIVCRFSGGSDLIVLFPDGPEGNIETSKIGLTGFTGLSDPLDLVEDPNTGNLYVSDFATGGIDLLELNAIEGINIIFSNLEEGELISSETPLEIEVTVTSTEAAILSVDLFLNNQFVRSDLTPPYEWTSSDDTILNDLSPGTYSLRAFATDALGNSHEEQINIVISDTSTPQELIFVFPEGSPIFGASESIGVALLTSNSNTSIANIQLFLDGNLIRQENIAPYQWGINHSTGSDLELQNLSSGVYELMAIATDTDGNTIQASIEITKEDEDTGGQNEMIEISFTTPEESDVFSSLDEIGVEVISSNTSGTSHIELFINNVLVRQENLSPYEWGANNLNENDPLLSHLSPGMYELKALATDFNGNSIEETVNINIIDASATQNSISLYPNPTTGQLNIDFSNQISGEAMIQITDDLGITVLNSIVTIQNGSTVVDLTNLDTGIYLIQVSQNNFFYNETILKE